MVTAVGHAEGRPLVCLAAPAVAPQVKLTELAETVVRAF
ncbi:hypothetical protein BDK92_2099 [Micromonospora pisi]|uniref:Uncharacterized protein n=1 Tax=Micromonospora pisi TaxID=589240 RepID=A0A495JFK1_9ACTN|nr:hypothetical protein BDK92_2099 [Micromonospora pisi]